MEKFPKYTSIENLTKKSDILSHKCVVMEKIHGTNARFGVSSKDGVVIGSRSQIVHKGEQTVNTQHGGHYGFVGWLLDQHVLLSTIASRYPDYIFYGEWCGLGINKGVKYCDGKDLYIFDIKNHEGVYLDWYDVTKVCRDVGLKHVPVVMVGRVSLEEIEESIDQPSVVGKQNGFDDADNTQEGFVVKTLETKYDSRGNRMIAKYKSQKWAEKAAVPKVKKLDPDKMKLNEEAREFAELNVTDGRISTIVDHIVRDSGNEELKMSRTGEFLQELVRDVMKDEKEVYDKLDKIERNVYNKAVNALGAKKWKEYLFNM